MDSALRMERLKIVAASERQLVTGEPEQVAARYSGSNTGTHFFNNEVRLNGYCT